REFARHLGRLSVEASDPAVVTRVIEVQSADEKAAQIADSAEKAGLTVFRGDRIVLVGTAPEFESLSSSIREEFPKKPAALERL
ncbi:MAG: hypothetical protein ACOCQM_09525, partial [Natronomonas sp.]